MEESIEARTTKLFELYNEYTVDTVVDGELVVSFVEGTPDYVKEAYYEAQRLLASPDYIPSR